MGVTALVMAGGKGTRMRSTEEKPLLKVGGKSMIERVLNALRDAEKIEEIVVAVSRHTTKTASIVRKLKASVLKTPGKNFVSDVQYAVKKLKLGTVLTISADLPLVTSEIIDRIITQYELSAKPALTVAVSIELRTKLGLKSEYAFEANGKILVPAGINVIDGKKIGEKKLEEEILVIDDDEVAVNVNTIEDLKIADSCLSEWLSSHVSTVFAQCKP
jgi:adenosylcobinamide-phosphate guanylyltransferase